MGQPGLGVMLNLLGGGTMVSKEQYDSIVDQPIRAVSLKDDTVRVEFEDGRVLSIWDGGQSCCENRYVTTDDDLPYFAGSRFVDAELGEHRTTDTKYEEHEMQFLNVKTTKGVITFETHNEHNGYYGGFAINTKLQ